MPHKPIDYSKTVIYYFYYNNDLLYIGHTTDFRSRKTSHKSCCFNEKSKSYQIKLYKYIRDNNINWNDIRWECVNYPCNNKNEANREEGRIQRLEKPICNYEVAGRTNKQFYDEVDSKKIKENIFTCECGITTTLVHRKRHEQSKKHITFIKN
jgi:predicted GIY-YIG superfamily endonuclease